MRHPLIPPVCRIACLAAFVLPAAVQADMPGTIERIKPSIVVVGAYKNTASPPFAMRGTGFAVGNGLLVATNAHVVPVGSGPEDPTLVVLVRDKENQPQIRQAFLKSRDSVHDLALLRIEGSPLPALALGDPDSVREGQAVGFTGFPIGGALGFSPVTHRGMISSITPIALPGNNARQISAAQIRQLKHGVFNIFQLDATAYPGNSGSPLFDVDSGKVLGIINMVFIKNRKESALSQPSGISYAIPAKYLAEMIAAENARP